MNVKLLRKVKKHILAEPKRLFMSWYIQRRSSKKEKVAGREFAKCGTAACIAGWTMILSGQDPDREDCRPHVEAIELLGIDYKQGLRLFEPSEWPEQFSDGLEDNGKKKTAEVAAARIEHFIKTKGRE